MVTSPDGFGILIGFLHFGQGPVWPANLSLTLNRAWHLVQTTEIAMKRLCWKKLVRLNSGESTVFLGTAFKIVFQNTNILFLRYKKRGKVRMNFFHSMDVTDQLSLW